MSIMMTTPTTKAACAFNVCAGPRRSRCLDHVVPHAKSGQNSYRNLVSCCAACNWQESNHPAEDFLRQLYQEGRLSAKDLRGRLRALQDLKAGKLRPQVFSGEKQEAGNAIRLNGGVSGSKKPSRPYSGSRQSNILTSPCLFERRRRGIL